jgi:hypothetical protein
VTVLIHRPGDGDALRDRPLGNGRQQRQKLRQRRAVTVDSAVGLMDESELLRLRTEAEQAPSVS